MQKTEVRVSKTANFSVLQFLNGQFFQKIQGLFFSGISREWLKIFQNFKRFRVRGGLLIQRTASNTK